MLHRGPDSQGKFIDREKGIFLSHNRLAILDTSSNGSQPMISNDANLINFNKGTTADQARGLGNSGNIDTSETIGQAVDLMNPYLALTYIIYHGQAT